MGNYYLYLDDEVKGPYSREQIVSMYNSGSVASDTQYCSENSEQWDPVESLIAQAPPKIIPPSLPSIPPRLPLVQNAKQPEKKSESYMNYVVLQVVLKEKFIGTGSGNLTELERVINNQAAKGYRLHTISTASSGSKGFMGGDRVQATLVFEQL